MCGIVALFSKHGILPHYANDLFTHMLRMDSIRGDDSTGVFGVTSNGHVDMMKGDTDGYTFTSTKNYNEFYKRIGSSYKAVVGHNRKATSGAISPANAHPFRERHIILVHNGVIHNAKGIAKTEVDSHAIAHALADHDAVTALGKLDGAFAIVWYDQRDKTLNMARNAGRPLFWLEYTTTFVLTSEIGLPYWLQGRENRKSEKHGLVPTDKILTFHLDNIAAGFTEVPYSEYKAYVAPTTYHSHYPPIHNSAHNAEPMKLAKESAKILLMPNRSDATLRAGEKIVFEISDSHQENGAEIMLGNPVIDGVKDENIFVRMTLKKGVNPYDYLHSDLTPKLWQGTIQFYRNLLGYPTVYVHAVKPYEIVRDANGAELDAAELAEAVQTPCAKCGGTATPTEAGESILRKRSNGTWRIVCRPCLATSIDVAKNEKPGVELRARIH